MNIEQADLDCGTLPPTPWNKTSAPAVVAALQKSGLSVSAFARRHNVTAYKIRRCQRLAHGKRGAELCAKAPLVALHLKDSDHIRPNEDANIFEVRLSTGLQIRFSERISSASLIRIIGSIKEAAC